VSNGLVVVPSRTTPVEAEDTVLIDALVASLVIDVEVEAVVVLVVNAEVAVDSTLLTSPMIILAAEVVCPPGMLLSSSGDGELGGVGNPDWRAVVVVPIRTLLLVVVVEVEAVLADVEKLFLVV
jgi:hypothetical protein